MLVLDFIGAFVFALRGAVAGVGNRLDLFGVLVLAFLAGNAGGIARDLLFVAVPPAAISDGRYLAVSLFADDDFPSCVNPIGRTYRRARGAIAGVTMRTLFETRADLHALCRLAGFNPVIAHEAPNTKSVIGIVASGESVAIVPAGAERLAMRGVSFRPLDVREVPEHLAAVKFALAWRKQGVTPTVLEFIEQAPAQPLNSES